MLFGLEATEGVAATLVAADAVEIYDAEPGDTFAVQERRAAGGSFSKGIALVGRQTRSMSFSTDFRGSGAAATAPPWGKIIRTSAFDEIAVTKFTVSNLSGTGFQAGELVQKSDDATRFGLVLWPLAGAGDLYVWWIAGTILDGTHAFLAMSSATTADIDAVDAVGEGFAYVPSSERLLQISIASWSVPIPVAGDVVVVKRAGIRVGSGQIVEFTTGNTDFKFALHDGVIADADVLFTVGDASQATIDAVPVAIHSPSATISSNIDGFRRLLLGSRCDWTLSGEAHNPMQFQVNASGQVGAHSDALQLSGIVFPSTITPRLFGATVGFGVGNTFIKDIAVKSVSVSPGNSVQPRSDANAPGGDRGYNVTDRDPMIEVTIDLPMKGSMDVITRIQESTTVRFACLLGSGVGNRMAVLANNCQIVNAVDGEDGGYATMALTLKPRRIRSEGDDELVLAAI